MSQTDNRINEKQKPKYFIREDRDGNLQLITCAATQGYPTVAAAKEAEIKDIQTKMRFDLETIGGLLNDIEEAKERQHQKRLYCEINGFLNEIDRARKRETNVKTLRP
jgi:hypothetical protein